MIIPTFFLIILILVLCYQGPSTSIIDPCQIVKSQQCTSDKITRIMCTIDTRDRVDTWSTSWSTLDWHTVDVSVDRLSIFVDTIEWRSKLAMTTHWMSVDMLIATLRSAVGRECRSSVNEVSVVCRWCILRSIPPPWWVLPYMGSIGMCGPKGYGFSALLVINWVLILAILPPFWS